MMKHALTAFLLASGMATGAMAQVPNGGFEDWTDMGTYIDPDGWITFNGLTSIIPGTSPSCEQDAPGAVGSYYATVTTRNVMGIGLLPGVITIGDVNTGAVGFPFASRPEAFTGKWQYGVQAQDTGMVMVYLTKWNSVTQEADSVGGGVILVLGNLSGWNNLNLPIDYFSSATPDTAYVGIISSMNSPVAGSFISVDDLGFNGVAAVTEQEVPAAIKLYPSPVQDKLQVSADRPIRELSILDLTGRQVMQQGVHAQRSEMDLSALHAGRYLVQLVFADGSRQTRSIVKD
jgi:hypothetical protein